MPPTGLPKVADAIRVPPGEIQVDGRLEEAAWSRAVPTTDFVQKEPVEGAPPSERTEVRFVYDDGGLYVGARMSSSQGRGGIQAPLGRRDSPYSPSRGRATGGFPGGGFGGGGFGGGGFGGGGSGSGGPELAEYILVSLDTFLDRRTAYSYGVTASGVRIDHQHLSGQASPTSTLATILCGRHESPSTTRDGRQRCGSPSLSSGSTRGRRRSGG